MNSLTAPAMQRSDEAWCLEAAEAHALTYLAAYANIPEVTRVTTSFKRAFGMDRLEYFPRPNAQTPAFVIATWETNGNNRVVCAFEGTTSLATSFYTSFFANATTVFSLPGRVVDAWSAPATTIQALIEAGNLFGSTVARRGRTINFAGFSLGAAVAEILSKKWAQDNWMEWVRLFTFGKPRVGNQRFNDFRPLYWRSFNTVLEGDAISSVPNVRATSAGSVFSSVPTVWTHLVRDPVAYVFNSNGFFQGGYQPRHDWAAGRFELNAVLTMNETNPWFWHNRDRYRIMWANWAFTNSPLLLYRLLGLEFPDDNQFGVTYQPGIRLHSGVFALGANIPDRDPPGNLGYLFRTPPIVFRRDTDVGHSVEGVWGGPSDDPQPWNVATPERIVVNRRRRRVRVN